MMTSAKGFTLIELLIAIVLVVIIAGAIYFCMTSALDSWSYSRDELSLQKVLSETMNKMISGNFGRFGLKDSLEVTSAGRAQLQFVPPWVDDTHTVANADFIYTLSRRIKPGTALPIGQIKMPESKEWQLVPVSLVDTEESVASQVRLKLAVPEGSGLRFIYHPDPEANPDVAQKVYWDEKAKQVFLEDAEGVDPLSKNLFGVEIINMELRYYTNANDLVTDREWVEDSDMTLITGVEVTLEARLNEHKRSLTNFVSMRNAPMRTGYLSLKKGMRIRVPDGRRVQTLLVTNLTGVSNNDRLQLEAVPQSGKSWRLTVQFERVRSEKPAVKMITIEYPPQTVVYTDYPKSTTDLGINLMLLGSDGLYDYDFDDVPGEILLEGDVNLVVTEMTIKGAGLFVRP